MSARTNRMAWNRLDLPEPFAPTVRDEGWGRGEGRQDGRGGRDGFFSKRGGCPARGVPTGRIWAWRRTDAVEMGLEVGGGLLPVRLEPLDDDLLDVHGAWEGVTAGCRVAICEVCPPTARAACFFFLLLPPGRATGGRSEGSRGVARASTGSGRACVAPVTRAVRTASPIRAPAPPGLRNDDARNSKIRMKIFLLRAARHGAVGSHSPSQGHASLPRVAHRRGRHGRASAARARPFRTPRATSTPPLPPEPRRRCPAVAGLGPLGGVRGVRRKL